MPMNSNLLTAFIAITSVAVVLQMLILLGIYLTMRRTTSQVHDFAMDFQRRTTPMIENARDILADATPKVKELTSNLVETSATLKKQTATLAATPLYLALRSNTNILHTDNIST